MRAGADKREARIVAIIERAFAHHAGGDAQIDVADLQKALGLRSEYLARRVLAAFDTNGDGVVRKDEFVDGVRALLGASDREKLRFAFRVHDIDGDGAVDRDEMLRMIALALQDSDVVGKATQPPELLVRALFADADKNHDGRLTFDEFEAAVMKRPRLLHQLTRNEALWIAPNEDALAWVDAKSATGSTGVSRFLEHGALPWIFLVLFFAAVLGLFTYALQTASGSNAAMQIGRATGASIDLCAALILVPMMRRFLSRVRATFLGRVLPLDDAIGFHRVVGHTMFALAIAHVAAFSFAFVAGHAPSPIAKMLEMPRGLTGIALFAVLLVMWLFALDIVRRSKRFELFYFTHLLYLAWLGLALVHAPRIALWIGVPLIGFAIEQILRLVRRGPKTAIVHSRALPSGVTRLELARPSGFKFQAGDYAFLRIPDVAKHEWHPFTISSAPERDGLTFHVRSLGNWTSALRRLVEAGEDAGDRVAYVDGPYGSPTAHIYRARVAVLIGAGIGVTPFASVLESMVLSANAGSEKARTLEKAYFFWLNRDQYSFEWFAALLSSLEAIDDKQLLDIHLCMTGGRAGVTALGLELARDVMHSSGRSDIITGLRTHTHLGPPDWEGMLGAIAKRHAPTRVDVFFCGPPGLARKLEPIALRLGMSFREERF